MISYRLCEPGAEVAAVRSPGRVWASQDHAWQVSSSVHSSGRGARVKRGGFERSGWPSIKTGEGGAGTASRGVGYTYLILDHGRVVARKTFGLAHTDADPPTVALSPDDRMNIASVTKTLTAVAALKLLAARHVSIDTPIYSYLPKSWTLGSNIKTITFRELLTHTSGIRSSQDLATGYDDLRTLIAQGINLNDKVYHYQNHNFALFRILIPYLNGFDDTGVTDIGVATSQQYLEYMNSLYGSYFNQPVEKLPIAARLLAT